MSASRLRVVVTAGPTREYLDPVRYLSNESSGRMGYALATAALAAGHQVTLISGPVDLSVPEGAERVQVTSALQMLEALQVAFEGADALFMAAAVADFRPETRLEEKWKLKEDGVQQTQLELVRNPDLLATVAADKGNRTVVAFALETSEGDRRAMSKLKSKNADFIVLNGPDALNQEHASVIVYSAQGEVLRCNGVSKRSIAEELMGLLPA